MYLPMTLIKNCLLHVTTKWDARGNSTWVIIAKINEEADLRTEAV